MSEQPTCLASALRRLAAAAFVGAAALAGSAAPSPFKSMHAPLHSPPCSQDDVQRELDARGWALRPLESAEALEAAFASERWNDRAWVLDALARGARAGTLPTELHRSFLARGLGDAHLSVRTRALELAAALAPGALLSHEQIERALDEPLPGTRLALVAALAAGASPRPAEGEPSSAESALVRLLEDDDERIRDAALSALAGRSDELSLGAARVIGRLPLLEREQRVVFWRGLLCSPASALSFQEPPPSFASWNGSDRALFRALRLLRGDPANGDDRAAFARELEDVEAWTSKERELLTRAARSWNPHIRAGLLGSLVRVSSAALHPDVDEVPAWELARAVADSGEPHALLDEILALPASDWPLAARTSLVEALAPQVTSIGSAALEQRIAQHLVPSAPRELRIALLDVLTATLGELGDDAAARLLARCLDDADLRISSLAYRSLADAPGGAREGAALFAAWMGLSEDERLRRLERTSRKRPLIEFRQGLLEWAAEPGERRRASIELLAAFQGDDEVRATLESWLREELFLMKLEGASAAEAEGRAAQLARALARLDPVGSVAALESALSRSHLVADDVAKAAAAGLGASAPGRARLEAWLGDDVGRRARVEVALVLLAQRDCSESVRSDALLRLLEDYDGLAWDLARRVVAALGGSYDPRALERLAELARTGDAKERGAALEALGRLDTKAATGLLERTAIDDRDLELRRMAVRLLGQRRAVDALDGIARSLSEESERLPPGFAEVLSDDIQLALLVAGVVDESFLQQWLARAFAESRRVLGQRLMGGRSESASFLWSVELSQASELARLGRLPDALERAGSWWELDARLLARLALEVAPVAPALGFELQRAGSIALEGERAPERSAAAEARARVLGLAWAAEHWWSFERLARAYLNDHRLGALTERAFEAAFGRTDRARGVDPIARLESALLQAQARAALAGGDLDAARALAVRAGMAVGASEEAARAQSTLEQDLLEIR